jgi:translation initiation factor IF-1
MALLGRDTFEISVMDGEMTMGSIRGQMDEQCSRVEGYFFFFRRN